MRSVDNTDRSVSSRSIASNDPLLLPTSLKRENVPPAVEGCRAWDHMHVARTQIGSLIFGLVRLGYVIQFSSLHHQLSDLAI